MHPDSFSAKSSTAKGEDDNRREIRKDTARAATALSSSEVVFRFGSANAEYIKGYRGVDNETGRKLRDGLKSLSRQKTGEAQKAGNAAEIHATSRDNAENIINKSAARSARADDQSRRYGTNHPVVDRIKLSEDGGATFTQMKFEASPNKLINKIVAEDGPYSRYLDPLEVCEARAAKHLESVKRAEAKAAVFTERGQHELAEKWNSIAEDLNERVAANREIGVSEICLEVPSDQVNEIKRRCREKAQAFRDRAKELDAQATAKGADTKAAGVLREKAKGLRETADRCDKLEERVVDSGLTTEEARAAATRPLRTTATEIAKTSHRAGVEGAKWGALIGAVISIVTNAFSIAQNEKAPSDAAQDIAEDTLFAAALGYSTAFAGSALKGVMQQSSSQTLRSLSATNAPALAVNVCISLGSSVKRYVTGEITEAQLLNEVGEKGTGMLSAGMMGAVGQVAIPIPFVGAAIGGMIGYTLSSFFYQSALEAAEGVAHSREELARIRTIEAAALERLMHERARIDAFIQREIPQLRQETDTLFLSIQSNNIDNFAIAINRYATLLGHNLQFRSMDEFDAFMSSDKPLSL
ncbi:hypothetical protein [Marinobacter sp.]|uniref:hypothetical protein n=1 Tax=Marinobacter sp. TaxID=50741 RepID=UPI003A93B453